MPIGRSLVRGALAGTLLTLALGGSAEAKKVSNPYDCRPDAVVSQSFSSWGDDALYTPAPDAGIEGGAEGWTLAGGAFVADDNEPWRIGGESDSKSLQLPEDSSAVSPPMCVDATFPHFRLFANRLSRKGDLRVDVLFFDEKGNVKATAAFKHHPNGNGWGITKMIRIGLFAKDTKVDATPIAFRFTTEKDSEYRIDDVYVDPMIRR
jgi:hypothetical protein